MELLYPVDLVVMIEHGRPDRNVKDGKRIWRVRE